MGLFYSLTQVLCQNATSSAVSRSSTFRMKNTMSSQSMFNSPYLTAQQASQLAQSSCPPEWNEVDANSIPKRKLSSELNLEIGFKQSYSSPKVRRRNPTEFHDSQSQSSSSSLLNLETDFLSDSNSKASSIFSPDLLSLNFCRVLQDCNRLPALRKEPPAEGYTDDLISLHTEQVLMALKQDLSNAIFQHKMMRVIESWQPGPRKTLPDSVTSNRLFSDDQSECNFTQMKMPMPADGSFVLVPEICCPPDYAASESSSLTDCLDIFGKIISQARVLHTICSPFLICPHARQLALKSANADSEVCTFPKIKQSVTSLDAHSVYSKNVSVESDAQNFEEQSTGDMRKSSVSTSNLLDALVDKDKRDKQKSATIKNLLTGHFNSAMELNSGSIIRTPYFAEMAFLFFCDYVEFMQRQATFRLVYNSAHNLIVSPTYTGHSINGLHMYALLQKHIHLDGIHLMEISMRGSSLCVRLLAFEYNRWVLELWSF
ncbi:hypothetical protein Ciccas_002980 [Cichlidogyrus casuarinus]|uniref:Uncharacterized protein n=1 Tax=Cichlidogyrus casuarinus TaxID=1844966 RepID=A0ABD2QFQ2_9PLAT